jgi:hypothetical protein
MHPPATLGMRTAVPTPCSRAPKAASSRLFSAAWLALRPRSRRAERDALLRGRLRRWGGHHRPLRERAPGLRARGEESYEQRRAHVSMGIVERAWPSRHGAVLLLIFVCPSRQEVVRSRKCACDPRPVRAHSQSASPSPDESRGRSLSSPSHASVVLASGCNCALCHAVTDSRILNLPWSERSWKMLKYGRQCIDRRSRSPDARGS